MPSTPTIDGPLVAVQLEHDDSAEFPLFEGPLSFMHVILEPGDYPVIVDEHPATARVNTAGSYLLEPAA